MDMHFQSTWNPKAQALTIFLQQLSSSKAPTDPYMKLHSREWTVG